MVLYFAQLVTSFFALVFENSLLGRFGLNSGMLSHKGLFQFI